VTALLQWQYSQTELIFWVTYIHFPACCILCLYSVKSYVTNSWCLFQKLHSMVTCIRHCFICLLRLMFEIYFKYFC